MRAHELIAVLAGYDPDAEVLLPGYEDGYDRIDAVVERDVQELDHHGEQSYLGAFFDPAEAQRQASLSAADAALVYVGAQAPELVGDRIRAVLLIPARRE